MSHDPCVVSQGLVKVKGIRVETRVEGVLLHPLLSHFDLGGKEFNKGFSRGTTEGKG